MRGRKKIKDHEHQKTFLDITNFAESAKLVEKKIQEIRKKVEVVEEEELPGRLDMKKTVAFIISETIKSADKSVEAIAEGMTFLMGEPITECVIRSWAIVKDDRNGIPGFCVVPFIVASGSKKLLQLLCSKAGGAYIEGEDAIRLKYNKAKEREIQMGNEAKLWEEHYKQEYGGKLGD